MAIVWYMVQVLYTANWYTCTNIYINLKNDLKYKHSGATGTLASYLVGVVSIEDITVYYS
jgi:hypothetical protein